MNDSAEHRPQPGAPVRWRLWDHIGIISGVALGLIVLGFLVVLAAAGDQQALGVIVVVVVGVALIYVGGRLHGLRGRS
ncbi:MAG: hypothetical protein WAL04_02175 [Acidimicrobiales bacterium]|jgi:hypothetical protein